MTKLDPRYYERSFAESKLAEIIFLCYTFEADERPSITEILHLLEDAIEEDERRKNSGEPWVYVPAAEEEEDEYHDDQYQYEESDYEHDYEHDYQSSESESSYSNFDGSDSNSNLREEEEASPDHDLPLNESDADLENAEESFDEFGTESGHDGAGAKRMKSVLHNILARKMMRQRIQNKHIDSMP